jgi:hypothetical protein
MTITWKKLAYTDATFYLGTTSVAINRASAAQALTGITGLTPTTDFTLTQNSVVPFTSVESGAVANTLYLKAGKVGIGTASPVMTLDVNGGAHLGGYNAFTYTNYAGTATATQGMLLAENATPYVGDSITSSQNFFGALLHPKITSTNTSYTTAVYGLYAQPTIDSSAAGARVQMFGGYFMALRDNANDTSAYASNSIYGIQVVTGNYLLIPSTAVTGSLYGVASSLYNFSGTVTTAYGFRATLNVGNASGPANPVITTYYGLYLGTPTLANGGTITNNYGVYSADTAAVNYFGGNVGVGTVAPTTIFDVLTGGNCASSTDYRTSTAMATISNPDCAILRFYLSNGSDMTWIKGLLVANNNTALVFGRQDNGDAATVEHARFDAVSNFYLGGTAVRGSTVGTKALHIFNGTAPAGTLTNGCSIYSTSGELYTMDAAGNATLQTPHDEDNLWVFDSVDTTTGKRLRIDMEKMVRFLNDHFGTDFVHDSFVIH